MTEEKKSMVPKLRFPEFTETWEQRELNTAATFLNGRAFSQSELLSKGKYPVLRVGNFYTNDKWYFSDLVLPEKFYANKGDLLYTWSATFGPHIWEGDKVIYHYHIWKLLLGKDTDKAFLLSLLQRDRETLLQGSNGSTMIHITKQAMEAKKLFFPRSQKEQRQIGIFFKTIDKAITLHQRKLDVLNKLKKYLLQKMFPENGQLIPELRFPAFSGAWEQRKLSEIVRMNARIGWQNLRQSEFLDDGDFLLITGTDFKNGRVNFGTCHYIAKERFDQDPKIQVEEGSILLTKDGTIGKVALVDKLSKPATLNAGVYNIVPKNRVVESRFLFQYLSAPFLLDYVNKAATGGTIKHLNQSILVDFPVSFPSVAEQEKIGKFLEGIDHVTTLHQRKLEGLRKLKKSLLQQMFV